MIYQKQFINFKLGIILLLFLCSFLNAQNNERWIYGEISLPPKEDTLSKVYIINQNNNTKAISDSNGYFMIKANFGDLLSIESEYYVDKKIRVSQNIYDNQKLNIKLNLKLIQLNEIFISKKLSGILSKDVDAGKKEDFLSEIYRDLNVNPDIKPIKDTSKLKVTEYINFERLYDVLSGDRNKRIKLMNYEKTTFKKNEIRDYFGDDFFINELKIEKNRINDFINYTIDKSPYLIKQNDLNYFLIHESFINNSYIYIESFKNK